MSLPQRLTQFRVYFGESAGKKSKNVRSPIKLSQLYVELEESWGGGLPLSLPFKIHRLSGIRVETEPHTLDQLALFFFCAREPCLTETETKKH